jgi:hypothetical protein
MSKTTRFAFLAVFLGLLLLVGLIFRQFVLENILLPAATMIWLLLRIFVLSIDQEVFWWALILLSVFVVFRALFHGASIQVLPHSWANAAHDRTRPWRALILGNIDAPAQDDTLREDLVWLLTALYLPQQPGAAKFQIRDAFLERRIPLTESIFTFLFPPPPPPTRFFQRFFRQRTGLKASDYMRSIEEVLSFMETSMERGHEVHNV